MLATLGPTFVFFRRQEIGLGDVGCTPVQNVLVTFCLRFARLAERVGEVSSFLLNFRAMLQANNDEHILGSSATGVYSYRIWLWKVPIVLTVDLQAKWDSENGWVKENCVEVKFDAPVYEPLNEQNFV